MGGGCVSKSNEHAASIKPTICSSRHLELRCIFHYTPTPSPSSPQGAVTELHGPTPIYSMCEWSARFSPPPVGCPVRTSKAAGLRTLARAEGPTIGPVSTQQLLDLRASYDGHDVMDGMPLLDSGGGKSAMNTRTARTKAPRAGPASGPWGCQCPSHPVGLLQLTTTSGQGGGSETSGPAPRTPFGSDHERPYPVYWDH